MKLKQRIITAVLTVAAMTLAISASPASAHRYRVRTNRVRVGTIDYGYNSPCYYGTSFYNRPFRRVRRLPRRDDFVYIDNHDRYDSYDRYDRRVRTDRGGVGVVVRF